MFKLSVPGRYTFFLELHFLPTSINILSGYTFLSFSLIIIIIVIIIIIIIIICIFCTSVP